jgi:hypothetical protein
MHSPTGDQNGRKLHAWVIVILKSADEDGSVSFAKSMLS